MSFGPKPAPRSCPACHAAVPLSTMRACPACGVDLAAAASPGQALVESMLDVLADPKGQPHRRGR